jgi:hypothetical protein
MLLFKQVSVEIFKNFKKRKFLIFHSYNTPLQGKALSIDYNQKYSNSIWYKFNYVKKLYNGLLKKMVDFTFLQNVMLR